MPSDYRPKNKAKYDLTDFQAKSLLTWPYGIDPSTAHAMKGCDERYLNCLSGTSCCDSGQLSCISFREYQTLINIEISYLDLHLNFIETFPSNTIILILSESLLQT